MNLTSLLQLLVDYKKGEVDIQSSMFGLLNSTRKELSDICVLYAITNYAAVPSDNYESTINEFKDLIKLLDTNAETEKRIFLVNSDPRVQDVHNKKRKTKERTVLCEVEGVQELYNKIRSHLDTKRFFSFEEQALVGNKLRRIVIDFILRYLGKIWEEKKTIALVGALMAMTLKK